MHDQSESIASGPHPPEPQLPPSANDDVPIPEALAFTFTGTGKEYFRIWIVNLFLTVATLGIYSAWAKVRRLQYFDRNTQLAGAVFDFRGDPKAILRGRVLAVIMLTTYHYAFGFSRTFGVSVLIALLLALPYLMRSAVRFRLHNTQYRGLNFDFSGSVTGAYRAYLPPLLTILVPGALLAVDPSGKSTAAAFLLYLGWPLMHGVMKSYQHRHLQFSSAASTYKVAARRFYKPYLISGMVLIGAMTLLGVIAVIAVALLQKHANDGTGLAPWLPLLSSLVAAYIIYLLIGPYIQVRIGNLAWSNTAFPGMEIRSTMSARAFARLQTVNVLLTLVTLGLYRPFAVVRIYRFRLANLTLYTSAGFEQLMSDAARERGGAAGDGVADFFGMDLSW